MAVSGPLTDQVTVRPVEWMITETPVDYREAVAMMEARVNAVAKGCAGELVWLLEHPPIYTAGTSARREDLSPAARFPVFESGRGGQYTYHGPGQRVAYVMLDLNRRGRDIRKFVHQLEAWIIAVLAAFGVSGVARADRVGVWVPRTELAPKSQQGREDKIAAIGIRVRRWISYHGISLNVAPDLSHYAGIVPCGIDGASSPYGVTSLRDLGLDVTMAQVDQVLKCEFENLFGSTQWNQPYTPL